MSFEIVRQETAFQGKSGKNAKPVKNAEYMAFVRKLPCLVTGAFGVEPAHLNTANDKYGHTGRGKSQRSSDRWCNPLSPDCHREQHNFKGGEMAFWMMHKINPHESANALWGAYQERGEDCHDWAVRMINSNAWRMK